MGCCISKEQQIKVELTERINAFHALEHEVATKNQVISSSPTIPPRYKLLEAYMHHKLISPKQRIFMRNIEVKQLVIVMNKAQAFMAKSPGKEYVFFEELKQGQALIDSVSIQFQEEIKVITECNSQVSLQQHNETPRTIIFNILNALWLTQRNGLIQQRLFAIISMIEVSENYASRFVKLNSMKRIKEIKNVEKLQSIKKEMTSYLSIITNALCWIQYGKADNNLAQKFMTFTLLLESLKKTDNLVNALISLFQAISNDFLKVERHSRNHRSS